MSSSQFLTDRTENSTPTTGCTNAVDSIVNQATSTENQKLDKITNTIEIQQQQFTNDSFRKSTTEAATQRCS